MKRIVLSLIVIFICTGCFKKYGCTSSNAFNFDPTANEDNGLCEFASDAFGGVYDGTQYTYNISLSGTVLQSTQQDSFIIFIADTHRVQIKEFYNCVSEQDSLGCLVRGYNVYLSGLNPCAFGWRNFLLTREGDSVITYSYQKEYSSSEKDSVIGRARKR